MTIYAAIFDVLGSRRVPSGWRVRWIRPSTDLGGLIGSVLDDADNGDCYVDDSRPWVFELVGGDWAPVPSDVVQVHVDQWKAAQSSPFQDESGELKPWTVVFSGPEGTQAVLSWHATEQDATQAAATQWAGLPVRIRKGLYE